MEYDTLIKSSSSKIVYKWVSTLGEAKTVTEWHSMTCGSGLLGSLPKDIVNPKYLWRYIVFQTIPGNLEYREPFFKEIVGRFNDSGMLKIWYHKNSNEDYGRIIIRACDDTPTEWIFVCMNLVREGWAHLRNWPIQDRPPTAREVYLYHLERKGFNNHYARNNYSHQLDYTIWCLPDNHGREIGLTSEMYVDEVFECIAERDVPHSSSMSVEKSIFAGRPLYRRVVERIRIRTQGGEKDKKHDPFAD